ncbi:inactive beta-amylase 9 [Ricinus communis]|uniref:Beta-amylase n=1 Tax=Ricinus communis TaxID=3988 RepID=B9RSZ6_RICCO|nr:inactive beta-amylase 9 [Ricinus communis]EEF45479.1 Beta-amylase, putative [Ricinus communis]|eukprot:XP_002516865.1 inactive beta-amylase 9 [Ricinus communis]
MEVSVIGSSQATAICSSRSELACKELRFYVPRRDNSVCFFDSSNTTRFRKSSLRFILNAVQTEPLRSDSSNNNPFGGRRVSSSSRSNLVDVVRLFVGLPLDAVSNCNTINHGRAIAAGLKALKLLGVEGVEMPVWWGVAEKEAMGKYDWSGYLALAEMVQSAGLKLHVSLCFHASKQPKIPLPDWVSRIGESEPGIFYTDRSGSHYRECLSLAVDDLPVLDGKSPIQVYKEFCESFKSSFSQFMDSTVTGITVGLGPNGELRYPSDHRSARSSKILGVGEFQCYDNNMLNLLKKHAEATGDPLWGCGGPHDVPSYDQLPNSNNFFKDNGGSWESPYGNFFLSWYAGQLLTHGDRILSTASAAFGETNVAIYGKIPLVHSWYKTRTHPAELTAGFYNTVDRDGYDAIAEMFARNSCKMILPGMDLLDEHQPQQSLSSPELLLAQIRTACRKHGVEVSGQNSLVSKTPDHFERIKKNVSGENVVDLFTYQRMGAEFFSPEHFPSFTNFVRRLNEQETLHADDLPEEEAAAAESLQTSSESSIQMQAA